MDLYRILLVDSDVRSARRPEASLTHAGHLVAIAWSGEEALEQMSSGDAPDLVVSDTKLAGMDGYELARRIRKQPQWSGIPFVFLTRSRAVEDRLRALELGVDDYLTKPIYVHDLVTRVNLLLSRKPPDSMPAPAPGAVARTRLSGRTSEVSLIEVLQTCEASRKSAVVRVESGSEQGSIYVRDGDVVDAEVGRRRGREAAYRILLWQDATFVVDFAPVPQDREETVSADAREALLVEAMHRADAWARLCEKMPPLSTALRIDQRKWIEVSRSLSEDTNAMLRLFDGKRSIAQAIDEGPYDDVSALAVVSQLAEQGVLVPVGGGSGGSGGSGGAPGAPSPASPSAAPPPKSIPPLAYTLSATELLKRFSSYLRPT